MKIIEENNIKYYIGQNAKDNYELYYKMSENDIIFHMNNCSGSHVYIKSNDVEYINKRILINDIIINAAKYTKQFSGKKAINEHKVSYIEKKYTSADKKEIGTIYYNKNPYIISI